MIDTTFRTLCATAFIVLAAAYPGTQAIAGSKIYQSVDRNGTVTFTDVPLLMESQFTPDLAKNSKPRRRPHTADQPPAKPCTLKKTPSASHCWRKPD